MIILKTSRELALMREAGRISQRALMLGGEAVEPGVSTWEIDKIIREYIEKSGAKPNFLGYGDFPASACISVNDTVIHGIPSKKQILKKATSFQSTRELLSTVSTATTHGRSLAVK